MLARLWWKDARLFWPHWLLLSLFAAGVQWFAVTYGGRDARTGPLILMALGWAALYAFEVGAAAFAGERETNTLRFLDTLPVGRPTLWVGKAAFAIVTTLALAAVLVAMASVATTAWDPERYGPDQIVFGLGLLLFEAVAWGLFWSSLLNNALVAGALAVTSVGLVGGASAFARAIFLAGGSEGDTSRIEHSVTRLVLALLALAGSRAVVAWRPRRNLPVRVRPEVVERPRRSPREGPAWLATVGRLSWETGRESFKTWCALALLVVVGSILTTPLTGRRIEEGPDIGLGVLATLVAGVGVFGPVNRDRTHRFLVHHGARPTTVWLVKQLVVGVAVMVGWSALLALAVALGRRHVLTPELGLLALAALDAFAVGQLCGLTIRRGITAGLVALLGWMAVYVPAILLYAASMVPAWMLMVPPTLLLAVSWGWAGDWMYDRPGAGRWLRLASLILLSSAATVSAYIGYRAWSVPDIGPPFDLASIRSASVPPGENAAEVYRRAARALPGFAKAYPRVEEVVEKGWEPKSADAVEVWKQSSKSIALTREASEMTRVQFRRAETASLATPDDPLIVQDMRTLSSLVALDLRERQARGDLKGAWDDIRVLLKMSDHVGTAALPIPMAVAVSIHQRATSLALGWAGDPRQTPEQLRAALDDLRAIPPLPRPSESLKYEYAQMMNTLDLPTDDLEPLLGLVGKSNPFASLCNGLFVHWGIAPAWERYRARRVFALLTAEAIPLGEVDAWQRPEGAGGEDSGWAIGWRRPPSGRPSAGSALAYYRESTPLARMLATWSRWFYDASDRQAVQRRGLEMVLALRIWQLGHDGAYPGALAELVPGELPRLPLDPYTGRPFGYVRSEGQELWPLERGGEIANAGPNLVRRPTRPGQWLLYSVGPDRVDNGAKWNYDQSRYTGDLVYPLPEVERQTP